MHKKGVKLNQEEIIRLGTPQKPFSVMDKVLLYLLKNDTGISPSKIICGIGKKCSSGHTFSIIRDLELNGLVTKFPCKCGSGLLVFPSQKGIKYAKSLKSK